MTKYRARNRIEQDYAQGYKHCKCEHTSLWHAMDRWANNNGACEKCICPKYNEISLEEALNDHTTLQDRADEVLSGHSVEGTLPKGFGVPVHNKESAKRANEQFNALLKASIKKTKGNSLLKKIVKVLSK